MGTIFFVNGLVLVAAGAAMAVLAVLFPTRDATFLEAAMISAGVGALVCLSAAPRLGPMHRLQVFALTASVWLTAAAAGALPLLFWDMRPTDAVFEAMSAITTTGSTVLTGLDRAPQGILMWRAVLQWAGGVGFIVTAIALLPILRIGGMQLFRSESSERGEKELASAARFAAATLWIYLTLTAVCALLYRIGGMGGFDAIAHAMTTLSTGGFANYDASFGHFPQPFLHWTGTVFMLAGALPFAWYIRAISHRRFASEQVHALIGGLAAVIAALTFWRIATSPDAPFKVLTDVAFSVVSVVTTTGFATTDYTLWGPPAVVAFFILTAFGGCTGSTAGGAKTMRWIVLWRFLRARILMLHVPHAMAAVRYEGRVLSHEQLSGIVAFFSFFFLTFTALAIALTLLGLDLATAISGALTALCNVGPGVGPIIGPSGNFQSLPDAAKWLLAGGMYLGRLEMLTVFVLVLPRYWRELA